MTFGNAVRSAFHHYAGFTGRARRSEYWYFALFTVLVYVAASVVDAVLGIPVLTLLAVLALLVPTLAVSVRRLHDTGRSGWWMLLSLVPFGGIVLLVFDCLDSEPGPNRFGPSPKQLVGGPAWPQQPPTAWS